MNVKTPLRLAAVILSSSVLFQGCAVVTQDISLEDRKVRVEADLRALFEDQDPVTKPISLYEAMARALKYNLDTRVQLMNEALAEKKIEVARMGLLPQMSVDAGYNFRDSVAASSSEAIATGVESVTTSTSQNEETNVANGSVVWNVLDFGVSYAQAKQESDLWLIAKEQRRKAVQNIMQDVRYAFWKALSAQYLAPTMTQLLGDIDLALANSREMQDQALQAPLDSLRFQQILLATKRSLWGQSRSMSLATTELARLMNLRPGTKFELVAPKSADFTIEKLTQTLPELERAALLERPELREEDYRKRIAVEEVHKAMLRMLPGLEINVGPHYDSNSYTLNQSWWSAGISFSWNLFNVFSGPALQEAAEADVELANLRRMSLAMAVLSQVHLAWQNYEIAGKTYAIAQRESEVADGILYQVKAANDSDTGNELDLIRFKADALAKHMQRDLAYSELENTRGRIDHSVGISLLSDDVVETNLAGLSAAIEESIAPADR